MKTETTQTEDNYLAFLKELHLLLSYTDKIAFYNVVKKHKVSKNAAAIMIEGDIVENNGKNAKACRWYWKSKVEPNIGMAKELIRRVNLQQVKHQELRKAKKLEAEIKESLGKELKKQDSKLELTIQEPQTTTIKRSFFWGIYCYEKTTK